MAKKHPANANSGVKLEKEITPAREQKIEETPIVEEKVVEIPKKKEPAAKEMTVIGGRLNVREQPTKASKVLKVLEDGAKVKVTEVKNGWAATEGGWVVVQFLK